MLENQVMADAVANEQIPTLELSIIMPCLNEAETLPPVSAKREIIWNDTKLRERC